MVSQPFVWSNNVSYTLLSTCNHEMGSVAIRLQGALTLSLLRSILRRLFDALSLSYIFCHVWSRNRRNYLSGILEPVPMVLMHTRVPIFTTVKFLLLPCNRTYMLSLIITSATTHAIFVLQDTYT